mmetsp:Transcript_25915/g.59675  ORF Transcript_25915/g.59675 Transcript_25915/m.59675 type:complete len:174 (+) Transcript_25915:1720-2241(+)
MLSTNDTNLSTLVKSPISFNTSVKSPISSNTPVKSPASSSISVKSITSLSNRSNRSKSLHSVQGIVSKPVTGYIRSSTESERIGQRFLEIVREAEVVKVKELNIPSGTCSSDDNSSRQEVDKGRNHSGGRKHFFDYPPLVLEQLKKFMEIRFDGTEILRKNMCCTSMSINSAS